MHLVKDTCLLPADIGNCQNYNAMWYFDTKNKRCRQFYYGGCGGNDNRFTSEQDCERRCSRREESPPRQPPIHHPEEPRPTSRPTITRQKDACLLNYEKGSCDEQTRRWYFNRGYGICVEFAYSGCDGNDNNFATKEECQNLCHDSVSLCELAPLPGRCDRNETKWHFDMYTEECQQFIYTGCDGNGNNFDDRSSCEHACKTERPEDPRPPPSQPQVINSFLILKIRKFKFFYHIL